MTYPVDWVDAFTDRAFGGNGCAVVHEAAELTADTCIAFTRETSLTECTFVGPSEVADVHVRYFVARREIPFAGHPTIATVASLVDRGVLTGPRATLETGAGVLAIEIDRSVSPPLITMTQRAPEFGQVVEAAEVAEMFGLGPQDIAHPPQVVSTGLPFIITLLSSAEALERAVLDTSRASAAMNAWMEKDLWPYLVALGGATERGATEARLLLSPPHPAEDAFTGSATGATAAFLWHHGLIDTPRYVAEQGHHMGRPGDAQVEILGDRNAITGVKVGGQAHILMRGNLSL